MPNISEIKIEGLEELQKAFKNLPQELEASVIRNIAKRPANRIVSKARELASYLLPFRNSKRAFAILPIKDNKQKFVEVGIKGRSLAYIFMFSRGVERHKGSGSSTGTIKSVGNLIQRAAGELEADGTREMNVELSKVIAKAFKRYVK
jgi:hypothetical protein